MTFSARDLALGAFERSGLAELSRRLLARRGRFVLELHGVARETVSELPRSAQPSFCAADLRALLSWLAGRFPCLTPEAFLQGGESGVLLTFDDGYANNVTNVLPLLEEYEVPAVFFVTTQHVLNPRNWLPSIRRITAGLPTAGLPTEDFSEELRRDLFDGMSKGDLKRLAASPLARVGGHTVSHPLLTGCDAAALASELAESKRFLEQVVGRPVDLFAYPTGDYDRRVAQAVRAAGYRAAFVEESRNLGLGRWEIPRLGLYSADQAYLAAKLSGLHRRPLRRSFE